MPLTDILQDGMFGDCNMSPTVWHIVCYFPLFWNVQLGPLCPTQLLVRPLGWSRLGTWCLGITSAQSLGL